MQSETVTSQNDTHNLVGNIDSDCFSFRVVVTIHRVDTEQHCNAKQHNDQQHQHCDHSHPDRYREEARAVIVVAKLVVLDAESLNLNGTSRLKAQNCGTSENAKADKRYASLTDTVNKK